MQNTRPYFCVQLVATSSRAENVRHRAKTRHTYMQKRGWVYSAWKTFVVVFAALCNKEARKAYKMAFRVAGHRKT